MNVGSRPSKMNTHNIAETVDMKNKQKMHEIRKKLKQMLKSLKSDSDEKLARNKLLIKDFPKLNDIKLPSTSFIRESGSKMCASDLSHRQHPSRVSLRPYPSNPAAEQPERTQCANKRSNLHSCMKDDGMSKASRANLRFECYPYGMNQRTSNVLIAHNCTTADAHMHVHAEDERKPSRIKFYPNVYNKTETMPKMRHEMPKYGNCMNGAATLPHMRHPRHTSDDSLSNDDDDSENGNKKTVVKILSKFNRISSDPNFRQSDTFKKSVLSLLLPKQEQAVINGTRTNSGADYCAEDMAAQKPERTSKLKIMNQNPTSWVQIAFGNYKNGTKLKKNKDRTPLSLLTYDKTSIFSESSDLTESSRMEVDSMATVSDLKGLENAQYGVMEDPMPNEMSGSLRMTSSKPDSKMDLAGMDPGMVTEERIPVVQINDKHTICHPRD